MKRREEFFYIFFIFLFLSFLLFGLSKLGSLNSLQSFLGTIFSPLRSSTYNIFSPLWTAEKGSTLEEENQNLRKQLVDINILKQENRALKDQFSTTNPNSSKLLPARIVGMRDENFTLDKGKNDGISGGEAVVFKDNLIGRITNVSASFSILTLLTSSDFSFTAKDLNTNAQGVLIGAGEGEMVLDKVLLSESIKISDIIVSAGDLDEKGLGIPPDLIVGRISSVDKKASSLFQRAKVQSFLNFKKLTTAFVYIRMNPNGNNVN